MMKTNELIQGIFRLLPGVGLIFLSTKQEWTTNEGLVKCILQLVAASVVISTGVLHLVRFELSKNSNSNDEDQQ